MNYRVCTHTVVCCKLFVPCAVSKLLLGYFPKAVSGFYRISAALWFARGTAGACRAESVFAVAFDFRRKISVTLVKVNITGYAVDFAFGRVLPYIALKRLVSVFAAIVGQPYSIQAGQLSVI